MGHPLNREDQNEKSNCIVFTMAAARWTVPVDSFVTGRQLLALFQTTCLFTSAGAFHASRTYQMNCRICW